MRSASRFALTSALSSLSSNSTRILADSLRLASASRSFSSACARSCSRAWAHLLELGYSRLKTRALGPHAAPCVIYYRFRHAEALGYGEGVGLARYAHEQPVCRLERRHVELAGGVHDALFVCSVDLQLRVVRRRSDYRAAFPRVLYDGYRQSSALRGVGTPRQARRRAPGYSPHTPQVCAHCSSCAKKKSTNSALCSARRLYPRKRRKTPARHCQQRPGYAGRRRP